MRLRGLEEILGVGVFRDLSLVQEDDFVSKCVEGLLLGFFNQGEVCTCPSRALVQETEPDWLLDLHEGYDFTRRNPDSVGSSAVSLGRPRSLSACSPLKSTPSRARKAPG